MLKKKKLTVDLTQDKLKLVDTILAKIDEIRPNLLACGLKSLGFKKDRLLRGMLDDLHKCEFWLDAFRDIQIARYLKVKAIVPESVWAMYAATGMSGSFEQEELKAARENVRIVWGQRPNLLRRHNDKRIETRRC